MMDNNVKFLQWSINFLIEKLLVEQLKMKLYLASNQQRNYQEIKKKKKLHSPFIDNIWDADLTDMQLTRKFNRGFRFLLCVIDIYSKYAWVIPLKRKKEITITKFSKSFR